MVLELDADRALALTYVPTSSRPALSALWRLDVALGAVLAGGREPLISQIKLAWWRDSLEKLDRENAPAEPVLEAIARSVLAAGVSGAALSEMEAGWTVLLSQEPLTVSDLASYSASRGGLLFRYSATILAAELSPEMERAGEGWALLDLARHSNAEDAARALALARERLKEGADLFWPSALRPLGMLAALARRDVERGVDRLEDQGAPRRMLRMLRHRLTGK
jgi:phytoene synthase